MTRLLENKIRDQRGLKRLVSGLKAGGKKIVFTNGCFDLIHWGHVKYLQDAKLKGDILIVGINSDASVRRIKGAKRPVVSERDRLRLIAGLESVDYVVLFEEDTPLKTIKAIKPDVLIKGADWDKDDIVGKDIVLDNGGRVITIKLEKGYSTTGLIRKIAERF